MDILYCVAAFPFIVNCPFFFLVEHDAETRPCFCSPTIVATLQLHRAYWTMKFINSIDLSDPSSNPKADAAGARTARSNSLRGTNPRAAAAGAAATRAMPAIPGGGAVTVAPGTAPVPLRRSKTIGVRLSLLLRCCRTTPLLLLLLLFSVPCSTQRFVREDAVQHDRRTTCSCVYVCAYCVFFSFVPLLFSSSTLNF